MNKFGERLKQAIKERCMTQAKVSRATGVSSVLISNYCSGKHRPKAQNLKAIASVLQVPEEWLLGYGQNDLDAAENGFETGIESLPVKKLKRCPFCGKDATFVKANICSNTVSAIRCSNCEIVFMMDKMLCDETSLRSAWNRRSV